jgi:lipoprotein-releasing system permease protein
MIYALKIATRYLTASKGQTALLVFGVAVGVFIFIFMSALIGGLAQFMVARIVGDMAHVTIQAEDSDPAHLLPPDGILFVPQKTALRVATLRNTENFVPMIAALPGVKAVSPQITGSGFVTRGAQSTQISINGVEPGNESAILNLENYMIQGETRLAAGQILIGQTLATDLDVRLGQSVHVTSTVGIAAVLTVSGVFLIGSGLSDSRTAYVSLGTARTLFAMPQGVTKIEIKLDDINTADVTSRQITALTGLPAKSWTEQAAQLVEALAAQARVGYVLKAMALITIVIGVASSILLSTYRRRPEIGIMRAMGASRGFVVFVFVTQGGLIGLMGGLIGATLGYLVLLPFPNAAQYQAGTLPLDINQGSYGLAILLTVIGAILASILPARSAARVDPVAAIGQ